MTHGRPARPRAVEQGNGELGARRLVDIVYRATTALSVNFPDDHPIRVETLQLGGEPLLGEVPGEVDVDGHCVCLRVDSPFIPPPAFKVNPYLAVPTGKPPQRYPLGKKSTKSIT